jgi:hypothetical protein
VTVRDFGEGSYTFGQLGVDCWGGCCEPEEHGADKREELHDEDKSLVNKKE